MVKVSIEEFDISKIKKDRNILVVGHRGTGKSNVMMDLLFNLKDSFDVGCGMTPTVNTLKQFLKIMPASLVFDEGFEVSQLERMLAAQKIIVNSGKERHTLLCLDDCMADKKLFHSIAMRDLHMNGRHYCMTFINCVQYMMDMGPDLRANTDYVIVLQENCKNNKEKLWKYFFGMFEKYSDFDKVITECTKDFTALVLDNTIQVKTGDKKLTQIFHYKWRRTETLPPFTLFRSVYWEEDIKYRINPNPTGFTSADKFAHDMTAPGNSANPRIETVVKTKK